MSCQKVMFAVCAAAALVALVAGQVIRPEQCSSNGQAAVQKWIADTQQRAQTFAKQMADATQGQFNADSFLGDVNTLMTSYANIANTSNGFSASQAMEGGQKIISAYMSMIQKYSNPTVGLTAMRLSLGMYASMITSQSDLLISIAEGCLSGSRS